MNIAVVERTIGTLRKSPFYQAEIIDEVLYGMKVEVLERCENDWCYIKTHYQYEGYIQGSELSFQREDTWDADGIIMVTFCDVLLEPRIQSYRLAVIPMGGRVELTDELSNDGEWCRVRIVSNELGWIRRNHIQEVGMLNSSQNEGLVREKIVEKACVYMGSQYRWGGKTTQGIDCSGLTSMAYMLNGILIYRDAVIKDGFPVRKITVQEIKKGDLIYTPGHIMLYIGSGRYIHSSLSGEGVRINSLDEYDKEYREDLAKSILYCGTVF